MGTEQKRLDEYQNEQSIVTELDWTFSGVNTKYMTHGLHPYPARMIPQIANRLISLYSTKGDLVWDPFCGSGSTLVESMLLGRKSIGTDLNPFAVFLSKVKTTPIDSDVLNEHTQHSIKSVETKLSNDSEEILIPEMHNIDYWFKEYVQKDLAKIRKEVLSIHDEAIRNFMKLCLASTVRDASNLKKNEFKIVHMDKSKLKEFNPDVGSIFCSHVDRCVALMNSFSTQIPPDAESAIVKYADNRNAEIETESVNLIVTSPPYGDHSTTVAYGQFSKYPGIWIGLSEEELKSVDRRGIGGKNRHDYSEDVLNSNLLKQTYREILARNEKRARQFYNFFFDLNESLNVMNTALNESGKVCIVIGNRLMSRVRIPTDKIVAELGIAIGFKHEVTIARDIPTKKMPWQNAPENVEGYSADTMHKESIVILKK